MGFPATVGANSAVKTQQAAHGQLLVLLSKVSELAFAKKELLQNGKQVSHSILRALQMVPVTTFIYITLCLATESCLPSSSGGRHGATCKN